MSYSVLYLKCTHSWEGSTEKPWWSWRAVVRGPLAPGPWLWWTEAPLPWVGVLGGGEWAQALGFLFGPASPFKGTNN